MTNRRPYTEITIITFLLEHNDLELDPVFPHHGAEDGEEVLRVQGLGFRV